MSNVSFGPRAQRVYVSLRERIARGELAAGAKLPPHIELATQYGVAPLTMRQVLARLEAEGFGSKPPVAYRALGFLVEMGFAHRIEGLSAFVACARPGEAHAPSFLVCRGCRRVAEEAVAPPLAREAEAEGFAIERTVVEAQGLCPACRGGA